MRDTRDRLPHEPSPEARARRLPPRLQGDLVLQAQERRRTSGLVQSINGQFVIDPEREWLKVLDDSQVVRLHLGNLGGSPEDYGLKLYDGNGDVAVQLLASTWYFHVGSDRIYFTEAGRAPGDLTNTQTVSIFTGKSLRWETNSAGLKAEWTYEVISYGSGTGYLFVSTADLRILSGPSQKLGFFNASSAGAVQQTLTDSTGGTPGSDPFTLSAVSGSGDDSTINDNFAKIRAVLAAYNLVG